MGKKRHHRSGYQKVDARGRFVSIPLDLLQSPAFLSLSMRARSAFLVLAERFNGFNNGRIGLSIDNLGAALGNQNHGANSRAMGELMERGFVECMANASHVKCKAREYRLTFISTGDAPGQQATNEWRDWTPPAPPKSGNMEKIGPEATATREWKPVEPTATRRKFRVEATATQPTETRRVRGRFRVEATAAHISNQYEPIEDVDPDVGNSLGSSDELRAALNRLVEAGEVTATSLALAINMPAGTMSKFRNGRGLPDSYRAPLHLELGRRGAFALSEAA
ncbi:hypothetical protein [Sphingopyxis sp. GW247-27LB]|uniref:hypothetical protein n=1 Tax=Sphingopyxis sp. GW247-27LB TaxID=2012632 RepID=UPI000BA5BF42|nr:hypothetical protein [Sphingopyxis sp. GW247-27LB]PAL24529.1 hypothetical protein CD928_03785 [Sphingopyxis sp. GW247-27LB]